jgi:hypothetical protein
VQGEYTDFPGFEHLVLEESYILEIVASPGRLVVRLDAVLTREHSEYTPPPPSERECFRVATIEFFGVSSLWWSEQGRPPAIDATGGIDYGTVDSFDRRGDTYSVDGDFGRIKVEARAVGVTLAAPKTA